MFDLQVLAWQADITRVTTLMLAQRAEQRRLSRRAASATRSTSCRITRTIRENMDRFAMLNRYHVDAVRVFPRASCRRRPTATARCSITRWCCTAARMSDGNQHNHGPLPIVLAGGASGKLKGGRHLR